MMGWSTTHIAPNAVCLYRTFKSRWRKAWKSSRKSHRSLRNWRNRSWRSAEITVVAEGVMSTMSFWVEKSCVYVSKSCYRHSGALAGDAPVVRPSIHRRFMLHCPISTLPEGYLSPRSTTNDPTGDCSGAPGSCREIVLRDRGVASRPPDRRGPYHCPGREFRGGNSPRV